MFSWLRDRRRTERNRARPRVETLETRLAPAAVVMNANTVIYTDIDGDNVTVHSSKPIFSPQDLADGVFTFAPAAGTNQQLEELDLTKLAKPSSADGTTLSITAVRSATSGGDGFVNVGYINGQGLSLGPVSIKGDLGRIDVGGAAGFTTGLSSLTVQSIGAYGTSTQGSIAGADLVSHVVGTLGGLTVKADVVGAELLVMNGSSSHVPGSIGTATIGGSLEATTGQADTGYIQTQAGIGSITVGGDLVGGDSTDTGEIFSGTTIGRVTVGGSLQGGTGLNSGRIAAQGNLGVVQVAGSLVGNSGNESGSIHSLTGGISQIIVSGSLLGGANSNTETTPGTPIVGAGSIGAQGNIGRVTIAGNVEGGLGDGSGSIMSLGGTIEFVFPGTTAVVGPSIGGSLLGGSGNGTGLIYSSGTMGRVHVVHDIRGGDGVDSGEIMVAAGSLLGATVGGSLVGAAADNSGEIDTSGSMGGIAITGDVRGGDGTDSGAVFSGGGIASVSIGGSLIAGTVSDTGMVLSTGNLGPVSVQGDVRGGGASFTGFISQGVPTATTPTGSLTRVFVAGSLVGGTADHSGIIRSNGALGPVFVTGDVQGGSADFTGDILGGTSTGNVQVTGSLVGGSGNTTGAILSGSATTPGSLGAVVINGNLVGGSISGSSVTSLDESGYIQATHITSVRVNGSVYAGSNTAASGSTLTRSGSIRAFDDIGTIIIKGSLVGNATNPVIISAVGEAFLPPTSRTDVAIGSLSVGGRVYLTNILAGYNPSTNGQTNGTSPITGGVNGKASIGTVTVGGDWVQSNLVAGVDPGADDRFGTGDDTEIGGTEATTEDLIAQIAKVVIGGEVLGNTQNAGDFYGFVAEEIGAFSMGGTSIPLKPGPSNDGPMAIGATLGVNLYEVP
jgi:hypothetical protein